MKQLLIIAAGILSAGPAVAWDYSGHRVVNQVALQSLPAEFPAFVKTPTARERIAFLAGEPDRWRNTQDHTLKHFNEPDHFLDAEELADFGLTPQTASPFRFEFMAQMAVYRAQHPEKFEPIDPAQNLDRKKGLPGFLPWTINEDYSKLKSGFSYLKTFQDHGGTADEVRNAQENILCVMGVMGHFLGESPQPLD